MERAVGYIRVSTSRQVLEGISLEAQEEKIRQYCALKDLELLEIVSDAGKSGSRSEREGYRKVITLCERRQIDAMVIYSISRFTRSTKDLFDFVDCFVIKGSIQLHSLSENLDTASPKGRFVLKVMGVMSELEREQIPERTKQAMAYKRDRGEKTGGKVPFGYDCRDGRKLAANEEEQQIIREIQRLSSEGFSNNAIAKKLNEKGRQTKFGGRWSREQIGRVLKSIRNGQGNDPEGALGHH